MDNSMFHKRTGVTDKGKDYEDCIVANFVLELMLDKTIQDFWISANVDGFGAFDDVILEVETQDGCNDKYALQLKHSSNTRILNRNKLLGKTGDFSFQKYFKSFQDCKKCLSGYNLILATNQKFNTDQIIELDLENNILKLQIVKSQVPATLKKCGIKDGFYKIEIVNSTSFSSLEALKEYEAFFGCFFLCTNQPNVDQVKTAVKNKMEEFISEESTTVDYFFKFTKDWGALEGKKSKLDKKMMTEVLALHLLESCIQPISFCDVSERGNLFQKAVSKFDVTVLGKIAIDQITNIWSDAKSQIPDIAKLNDIRRKFQPNSKYISTHDELTKEECTKVLWIKDVCPLIVTANEKIHTAIRLCPNKKFIIIGTELELSENCKIFRNLSDLSDHKEIFSQITENFQCSLPGGEENLHQLLQKDPDLKNFITTSELLQMVYEPYVIKETDEELPVPYVERFLSRNFIDVTYLETIDEDVLVVISNVQNLEEIASHIKKGFINGLEEKEPRDSISRRNFDVLHGGMMSIYTNKEISNVTKNVLKNQKKNPQIYVVKEDCTRMEFQKVCARNAKMKRYHHFRFVDGKLEWLDSVGDIMDLDRFRIDNYFCPEKLLVMSNFHNDLVLVADEPGKGKSILLKSLKNSFTSRAWTILFSSEDIRNFYKIYKLDRNEFDLENFLLNVKYANFTIFEKRILKILLQRHQIIYLWDALDEVNSEVLEKVTNFIQNISKNCVANFITCRLCIKNFLESKFCVLSKVIMEFDDDDQNFYIGERLRPVYSEEENFKNIISRIRKCIPFKTPRDFLSFPLQLYMLTELLLKDKEKYLKSLNTTFSLINLYENFINETLKLSYKSTPNEYSELTFEIIKNSQIELYQTKALITLFDDEILNKLKIVRSREKRKEQKEKTDVFGILNSDKNDIKQQFVHVSYAEYFAASYFTENYEDISNFKNILFDKKYINVRFFFDLLMARNLPLHTAILHKNFEILFQHQDEINKKDEGGRNVLHLLCSWGERYPILNVENKIDSFVLDDKKYNFVEANSKDYYERTLEYLLEKCDFREIDRIFNVDALIYAEYAECLLTIAFIEKKYKLGYFESEQHGINCSTLYYLVFLVYHEFIDLFEQIKFVQLKLDESLLHLAIFNSNIDCLKQLLLLPQFKNNINYTNTSAAVAEQNLTPFEDELINGFKKFVIANKDEFISFLWNVNKNWSGDFDEIKNYFSVSIVDQFLPLIKYTLMKNEESTTFLVKCLVNIVELEELIGIVKKIYDIYEPEKIIEFLRLAKHINFTVKNGLTPLQLACSLEYEKIVELLIKSRANVNAVNEEGVTPLHLACQKGHEGIVELLIKYQADVNAVDKDGDTPLYDACLNGYQVIAELLIKSQADVNVANKDGFTPLFAACHFGHENLVEFLIKSQANVNATNKQSRTPLYAACFNGHEIVAKLLIKAQADINAAEEKGFTPLYEASLNGLESLADLLIKCQADVDAAQTNGFTPLYAACCNGHKSVAELLIKSKADVNALSKIGTTPLHVACYSGHDSVVKLLIKSGAHVNAACNEEFLTPLHLTCLNGHKSVAELLLNAQANINAANINECTSLYMACENGHENIVEFLIKYQADVNAANKNNVTPLFMACQEGHENIVNLLIKSHADLNFANKNGATPLLIACQNGHESVVDLLIQSNADVNAADENGVTPLYGACLNGYENIVQLLLIKSQADVNAANKDGLTPLQIACYKGQQNVVELLIKSQADVNSVDKNGFTPLHFACLNGHENIVELLIKFKANVNATDNDGRTPLATVSDCGNENIFLLLQKSGASTEILDNGGSSILSTTCIKGYYATVDLLISWGLEIDHRDKDGTIEHGADVNHIDKNGITPLGAAFHNHHQTIVDLLIEHGADLNHLDTEYYSTPLYVLCEMNALVLVQSSIKMGADVNTPVYNNWTPIHIACFKGYKDIVEELLKSGADILSRTGAGDLPIDLAREEGHMETVKLIVLRLQVVLM